MEEISDNEHEQEELEKPKPKRVLSDAQREILKKGREAARQKRESKKVEETPIVEEPVPEISEVAEVKPKRKYTKKVKSEPVPEVVPEPVVKTRKPRALKVDVKPEPVVETKPKVEELLERLIEVSSKKTKKVNPVQDEAKPKTPKQKKTKVPTEKPEVQQWQSPKPVRPSVLFM
jgi:hypothetical protein